MLDRDTTLIDFGAWIGPTVMFGASFAKEVWGFEPDPAAYDRAVKTLIVNRRTPSMTPRIHLRYLCISDSEAPLVMVSPGKKGDSASSALFKGSPLDHGGNTWKVPCTTLPRFVAANGIGGRLMVKMDSEGGEIFALKGILEDTDGETWFERHQASLSLSLHILMIERMAPQNMLPNARDIVARVLNQFAYVYQLEGPTDRLLVRTPRARPEHRFAPEEICPRGEKTKCQHYIATWKPLSETRLEAGAPVAPTPESY
jgi:FkbM family methyltransferase